MQLDHILHDLLAEGIGVVFDNDAAVVRIPVGLYVLRLDEFPPKLRLNE
jgi:hypothetical protein